MEIEYRSKRPHEGVIMTERRAPRDPATHPEYDFLHHFHEADWLPVVAILAEFLVNILTDLIRKSRLDLAYILSEKPAGYKAANLRELWRKSHREDLLKAYAFVHDFLER
jgi:hypothetical protein